MIRLTIGRKRGKRGMILVPFMRGVKKLSHPTDRVALLIPRPFDRRIVAQGGVFTYHYDVREPLKGEKVRDEVKGAVPDGVDLVRIRVLAKSKPFLQRQLSDLGISRKTLFPDLEGLSAYINWRTCRSVERRRIANTSQST
jgi:hypothetical protein